VQAIAVKPPGIVRSRSLRQAFLCAHFLLSVCVGHLYLSSPLVLVGTSALIGMTDPRLAAAILASVCASVSLGHAFSFMAGLADPSFFEAYESRGVPGGTRHAVIRKSAIGLALSVGLFAASVAALVLLFAGA
jgi:hypothetical protein